MMFSVEDPKNIVSRNEEMFFAFFFKDHFLFMEENNKEMHRKYLQVNKTNYQGLCPQIVV